jgi:hypothetical protein
MNVTVNYFVDVDRDDEREYYFAEILSQDGNTLYSHLNALRSFSYREDMVRHINRKCAELGWVIDAINDESTVPSHWEEQI